MLFSAAKLAVPHILQETEAQAPQVGRQPTSVRGGCGNKRKQFPSPVRRGSALFQILKPEVPVLIGAMLTCCLLALARRHCFYLPKPFSEAHDLSGLS